MKQYKRYKIYLVFMALLISHDIWAQETKLSKSINKTFDVRGKLNLDITNKYGSVIIDTWSRDEVGLKIEILAYGKDENAAEKLIDRIEFDFKHADDFLEVESVFDRKKSFFKDLVNAVSDYSASLLSKHKLQVNYELNIPESTSSVTVDNRFGDVHIGNVEGSVNVTLAHGNLRVDELRDYARINVNYGNARIKNVNEANMSLKGAELDLEYVKKLNLNSSSSKISIGKALDIDLESTNDNINIGEVYDLSGAANFTEMIISDLTTRCRLNQSYGEMTVKYISEEFVSIRLNGKSTDYSLVFSGRSSFESQIHARDDKLKIANYAGQREKRYLDDKSKFVRITGTFGKDPGDRKLNVDAQNGEVNIDFKDVLTENYNK